jgi:hypothetical protein
MKYTTELLAVLLIFCVCYIGCNWNDNGGTETVKSDTTETLSIGDVEHKRDSIIVHDSFPYPVPYLVWKAPKDSMTPLPLQISLCDSLRSYTTSIDTTVGKVTVHTTVQGKMLHQEITLQAYIDSILRTDTLKQKITKTITERKRIFAPTFGLRIDSVAVPSIGLMMSNKKGNIIYSGEVSTKKDVTLKVGFNLNR